MFIPLNLHLKIRRIVNSTHFRKYLNVHINRYVPFTITIIVSAPALNTNIFSELFYINNEMTEIFHVHISIASTVHVNIISENLFHFAQKIEDKNYTTFSPTMPFYKFTKRNIVYFYVNCKRYS